MSETTPAPVARRRRAIQLALAISTIISPTLARSLEDREHNAEQGYPDSFAENANCSTWGSLGDVNTLDGDSRPAPDQRAAVGAGADVVGGIVSDIVASITRYMRGWPIERVRSYCRQKRWGSWRVAWTSRTATKKISRGKKFLG